MFDRVRASKSLPLLFLIASASSVWAQVQPDRAGLGQKEFRHPGLNISRAFRRPNELPPQAAGQAAGDLAALGAATNGGRVDVRGGRWATLIMARPLIPGKGVGNGLSWAGLGRRKPSTVAALGSATADALRAYLQANAGQLRLDMNEIAGSRVAVLQDGDLVQLYSPRVFSGIPVRGSYLTAVVSKGNLILMGTTLWGDIDVSTTPDGSEDDARAAIEAYTYPYTVIGGWRKSELVLVPFTSGNNLGQTLFGRGYTYRLAWSVSPTFAGSQGHWEALVDAHSGEVLSFKDTNRYQTSRRVQGGVYPVSNDGVAPDGVEQAGWPMPFDIVSTAGGPVTTDSGGNLPSPVSGNITSNLSGQYISMNDNCGSISLTSPTDIDFGTSGGTDCVTPGFGGAGNTHASRTGFYELNRIAEMGRGQLPGNTWLQQQLTANMNINNTCNAFWNGVTVNFYRSGGSCSNTGEIAGVFDHEWGHGLDANDANPGISSPSGEGIADLYMALRLNDSCIGRNFQGLPCSGNGDPCVTCTGVRDIDYANRVSTLPHTYTWSNANCGGSVHCIGAVYAEAVWDLWKRDLATLFNMSDDTAHEVVTRLTFQGGGNVGTWFSGGPPSGGCGASSGYMQFLAADDDNGNLNDGTPHMTAIFAAFDRLEIACPTPDVQNSGCGGIPTTAPTVTVSAVDRGASLSWNSIAGATKYQVFRTDGVFGCSFGKVKVGETTGTFFSDTGLQNGRQYSYIVIPIGGNDTCMGPASSCASVTPAAGPNLDVDPASALLSISTGDADAFIDNCETASMTFDVVNTGLGALTNALIVSVTSPSHSSISISTTFPSPVSPSSLAEGASGSGSFGFTAEGLSFGDTVTFLVEVTADELSGTVKSQTLDIVSAESDFQIFASRTFSFESDAEGWQVVEGTFNRSSSGGGAQTTSWYEASSANLDDQCDQIRSPKMALSATSTLSLWNQFQIEPIFGGTTWYDRANVGILEVDSGSRTPVNPDGGRTYNASGPEGTCGTAGQDGWADTAASWGQSTWSDTALGSAAVAGQLIQLDVRYGTDPLINGFGFRFDQVTVTDVTLQVADVQPDNCNASCSMDADCNDGNVCTDDVCTAGVCSNPPVDGISCSDGDACTTGDACSGGGCVGGAPPNCDDVNVCTDDSCNPATGCVYTDNTAPCDNGDACTTGDACSGGACVPVPCGCTGTPFTVLANGVFDNKNQKDYFTGGPEGSAPLDDLRTLAEEFELEMVTDDPSFYWEARYEDLGAGTVCDVDVLIQARREAGAVGTLVIEVYVGGVGGPPETSQTEPVSTLVDNRARAGLPASQIIVPVPSVGGDPAATRYRV